MKAIAVVSDHSLKQAGDATSCTNMAVAATKSRARNGPLGVRPWPDSWSHVINEPAIRLTGDLARGEKVFVKRCANCHRQGKIGHEVGPNLASLTNKTPKTLLTAILDPSAAVEAKYLNYSIVTNEGRVLAGILTAETASSITLLAPEGRRELILRRDFDQLQSTGKSLMPDGVEKEISPQDLADLFAFIRKSSASKE